MAKDGDPDFQFLVFDDYTNPEHDFETRLARLTHVVLSGDDRLRDIQQVWITDMAGLDAYEAECLEEGFEGVMLRKPKSPYKFGRSTVKEGYLLKVKRFAHDEAEIIGFEELMHNGNESFKNELGRTTRSDSKDGLFRSGMIGAYIEIG